MRRYLEKIYKAGCDFGVWLMEVGRLDESHENDNPQERTENQAGSTNYYQLVRGKLVEHMWITILCLLSGTLLGVAGILASLNAQAYWSVSVWLAYLSVVVALIVPFKWLDDARPNRPSPPDPPRVVTGTPPPPPPSAPTPLPSPVTPPSAPTVGRPTPSAMPPNDDEPRFMDAVGPFDIYIGIVRYTLDANTLEAIETSKFNNAAPFRAHLQGRRLCIDCEFATGENTRPVKLVDNTLSVPDGFDRNWDAKALEVVNRNGAPVLQVEYDGNTATVGGVFLKDGKLNVIDKSQIMEYTIEQASHGIRTTLRPMFKYPSKDNRSVRTGNH